MKLWRLRLLGKGRAIPFKVESDLFIRNPKRKRGLHLLPGLRFGLRVWYQREQYNSLVRPCCVMRCLAVMLALLFFPSASPGTDEEPAVGEAKSASEQTPEVQSEKPATEKRKKPPLEIGPLLPRFGQDLSDRDAEGPAILVKPGHWASTAQTMKANYSNFVGKQTIDVVDESNRPVALEHTHFGLQTNRSIGLAKGRAKRIDSDFFIPLKTTGEFLLDSLVDADSGVEAYRSLLKLDRQPAYQYTIVVLAKAVDQYAFLKVTNTVRAPWEAEFDEISFPHYQIALVNASKEIPLSDNPLTWTNIAYVIWDEVDPTQLTDDQQHALVDWLHWGGRLIVNGPDSLSTLRGSFLDPYLPADDGGPRKLTTVQLDHWSTYWGKRTTGNPIPPLSPAKTISAIELTPREGATELAGGANLFCERRVGSGSIIVSAIQLANRDFINWRGYDGFLNGGLLRRPGRLFSEGPYGGSRVTWDAYPAKRLDAQFTTPLRLFARDALMTTTPTGLGPMTSNPIGQVQASSQPKANRPGGFGAWDEFSPVANTARDLLLLAAGVQVPGAGFVLGCLAFYLLVLVPLNWLVFHTIERVEWAWIAVPLIALIGTWVVVKQAQLDIGFVRADRSCPPRTKRQLSTRYSYSLQCLLLFALHHLRP